MYIACFDKRKAHEKGPSKGLFLGADLEVDAALDKWLVPVCNNDVDCLVGWVIYPHHL